MKNRIEEVIVFNGEVAVRIGVPFFLDHPEIQHLDGKGIVQMYQATQVYASLIESKREEVQHISPEYRGQVKRGAAVLEGLITDLYGKATGELIIHQTLKTILDSDDI